MGTGPSSEINGVRVFKVHPGSPAAEAGLEVFFDFVVEVNGVLMDPEQPQVFAEKIKESEGSVATLKVYNARCHTVREVAVRPQANWGSQGQGKGLLGATVRFDSVDPGDPRECPGGGVRVLDVFPCSPAAHAGLVPFQDYLLGTAQAAFRDVDELVEAVQAVMQSQQQTPDQRRGLEAYVYNSDTETVREVLLVPNNDWGGEGCIGCDIGTGLLHRIPQPRNPPGGAVVQRPAPIPTAPMGPPPGTPGVQTVPMGPPPGTPGVAAGSVPTGMSQPAYPPGYTPPPKPASVTGVTPNPSIPPVPTGGPTVAAGSPAIRPSGMWAPSAGVPPPPGTMPAMGTPGPPPQATPATGSGLPMPPGPPPGASGAGAVAAAVQKLQQQQHSQPQAPLSLGLPRPQSSSPPADDGAPSPAFPKAPPSTPLNVESVPESAAKTLAAVQERLSEETGQDGSGPSMY